MANDDIHTSSHQIGMAEHHALWATGGAGRIHQQAHGTRLRRDTWFGCNLAARPFRAGLGIKTNDSDIMVDFSEGIVDEVTILVGTKNDGCLGVPQNIGQNPGTCG